VTHVNLNDDCVEGLAAPGLAAFSVQFTRKLRPARTTHWDCSMSSLI